MPVDRFNGTEFKKRYPNLFKVYTKVVKKEELDLELLRNARPDLFAEFQVRPLRITYEPPGAPGK